MQQLPFQVIDLTHSLNPNIPTWNGHCGFAHQRILDHDPHLRYSFQTHQIKMIEGIGTHLDAPLHAFKSARDVASLDLNELIAKAVVIDVSQKAHEHYAVSPDDIMAFEKAHGRIEEGCFVIVNTGWSQYWLTPARYRNDLIFPYISAAAVELLVHERNVAGLGVDTLSPDCPKNDEYPVHNIVLGADKYLVENIANAHLLPPTGSYTFALPMKIQAGTEAPIRLIGLQFK